MWWESTYIKGKWVLKNFLFSRGVLTHFRSNFGYCRYLGRFIVIRNEEKEEIVRDR